MSKVIDTELVEQVVAQNAEPVANGLAIWDGVPSKYACNFDGSERERFTRRMQCMAAANAGDPVGQEIAIKYWFLHEVNFTDAETGETVKTFRTVLIDPEGKTLSVVSLGVAKAVKMLAEQFGDKPIEPAYRAKVVRTTTSNKRQFYQLVPV